MKVHAKHFLTRLAVLALTLVMLFSAFPLAAAAESAETDVQDQNVTGTTDQTENQTGSSADEDEEIVTQVDENSYSNYLKKIAGMPKSTKTVVIDLLTGKVNGSGEITSYEGKNAVLLKEGESLDVTVEIPETGIYYMDLEYCAVEYKGQDIELRLRVDGKLPFSDAKSIAFSRSFKDSTGILQDANGNDDVPEMEEVFLWKTVPLKDYVNYVNEPYCLYLEAGTHVITLQVEREALAVTTLTLGPEKKLPSYAELKAEYDAAGYKDATTSLFDSMGDYIQAETPALKTSASLIALYDRTSPATLPYSPSKIRRNTIGQDAWSALGQTLTYEFTVPESGLYEIGIKYRQCYAVGSFVYRDVLVDGVIPCQEFENVVFTYNNAWEYKVLSDANGNSCKIYLEKGKHTLSLEVALGGWSAIMQEVDVINREFASMYRRITMVTSATPDPFRDYNLEVEIPGLIDDMNKIADDLEKQAAALDVLCSETGEKSASSETLRSAVRELRICAEKPDEIKRRLGSLRDGVTNVSAWLNDNKKQPLEMDYLTITAPGDEHPIPTATFWEEVVHFFKSFFASFTEDYNSISDSSAEDAISIWITDGREQMQALKTLINSSFTVESGIPVKLTLTQGGLYEALLAGVGPDLAIGQARITPVNYASRGIAVALDDFDTFDQVATRFMDGALDCYQMGGKTYGLPVTQNFFMLFYRKDIFQEMGLSVPTTWDEFINVTKTLQSNNMTVRLPYSSITLAGVQDAGIGMKDIFATLFLQKGGNFYSDDMTETQLGSDAGLEAFKFWTSFYTEIGVQVDVDFQTRFRTGEVPMGIENVVMYNTLSAVGSEIRGLWAMAPLPGTVQADGSVNYTAAEGGTACLIFNSAKNYENCWKFLDWYTRADTQHEYGTQVENMLGVASRYYSANLEAFSRLPWKQDELNVMESQRSRCTVIPEVPGAYFFPRCIDSAFRDVQNKKKNSREVWLREVKTINKELDRKNKELGTGKYAENKEEEGK